MSRNNKVNRDRYTQRGRLTPDEAGRELQKMRQIGSQHTWQPSKKDDLPRLESKNPAGGTETTEDQGGEPDTSQEVQPGPALRAPKGSTAMKSAVKSNAKSSKLKAAKTGNAKKTGKAKAVKAAKSAAKGNTTRRAVLARNTGGGSPTKRAAATRNKR